MIFALDTAVLSGIFLYVHSVFQTNTDQPTPPLLPMKDSFPGSFTVPCPMPGPDPFNWAYCAVMGMVLITIALYLDCLTQNLQTVCLILTAVFHREW